MFLLLKGTDTVSKYLACIKCETGRAVSKSTFSLYRFVVTVFMYRLLLVLRPISPSYSACQRGPTVIIYYP
jgi:hypothetical protein